MTQLIPDLSNKPYGGAFAVMDTEVLSELDNYDLDFNKVHNSKKLISEFKNLYREWIKSGTLNNINGLDHYKYSAYSNGTTEAFDKFYLKNTGRRFRCFRGDYVYHQIAWRQSCPQWFWLDDACLDANDAVVVSLPFANTGREHHLHQALLEGCDRLGIPVLVDCAYFGICADINFNFDHKCITDIVFSLSKTFPVAYGRIGLRLTKEDDDDTLFMYSKIDYNNKVGADVGMYLMSRFSPDYIYNKYRPTQERFCKELEVDISNTVMFATAQQGWEEYLRGGAIPRLSFHKFLPNGRLNDSKI